MSATITTRNRHGFLKTSAAIAAGLFSKPSAATAAGSLHNRYYKGPVTDHFAKASRGLKPAVHARRAMEHSIGDAVEQALTSNLGFSPGPGTEAKLAPPGVQSRCAAKR